MYIGVDLGGSFIKSGLLNAEFNLLYKQSLKTPKNSNPYKLCKAISGLIFSMLNNTKTKLSSISGIGIACPGVTDGEKGLLIYPPNLNFRDFNITDEMKKYVNIPIHIENDANCSAICQFYKASKLRDISNMVLITIGTGIGGGIIIDKKLYKGSGFGGEIGHMKISLNGKKCSCNQKGCFEAYASISALIKQTKSAAKKFPHSGLAEFTKNKRNKIDGKTAFNFAKQNDPAAKYVLEKYIGEYLATGISNIINIFSPQAIYISGGISNEADFLTLPLKKAVRQKILLNSSCEILICDDFNDAGIIGAGLICKDLY